LEKTAFLAGSVGFVGSNLVLQIRRLGEVRIVKLDSLTYAVDPPNLKSLRDDASRVFVKGDI
jgi:dTDP-D-glucose 4,6-dehydratase